MNPLPKEENVSVYNNDELDVFNLVERGILFVKNYGRILLISSIIGLALSLLSYVNSPKQYTAELLLHSTLITNQEAISIIDSWQDYLSKGDYARLSQIWHCNEEDVKKVSKISAEEIQKLYSQNNPNGVSVTAIVKDVSILGKLQGGINYGFENSPFIKQHVAAKKSRLNDMIVKVTEELNKLNVTKNALDSMILKSNRSTPVLVDVSRINSEWIELNEKLLSYREEAKFVDAVQVLEDFTVPSKPSSPNLMKSIFFGIAGGLFIGYLIALAKHIQRRIKISSKLRPL